VPTLAERQGNGIAFGLNADLITEEMFTRAIEQELMRLTTDFLSRILLMGCGIALRGAADQTVIFVA
jgi:hypothetical protein